MKDERFIPIRVAVDQEFKESFWNYDPEKVIQEASEEFGKEFGLAGFRIASRKTWDSCGSSQLKNFPESIIGRIPREVSSERVSEFLIAQFKEEINDIFSRSSLESIFSVTGNIKREQDGYRMLANKLERALNIALLTNLKHSFKKSQGITVGFSGKLFSPGDRLSLLGTADSSSNFIVLGICFDPKTALLHEVGHLFGADHSDEIESIMHPEIVEQKQRFTEEDKEQIRDGLVRKSKR